MKTIKICHIYYDIMNLYGESGNLKAIYRRITENNHKCEIHFKSINDKIDFKAFDLYYLGSGTEESQKIVLNDLMKYQTDIKDAIEENKFFIVTGNALELLGKYLEELNSNKITCLNIFDFYTKVTDFRIVGEQIYITSLLDKKIIGFQNRNGVMFECNSNLFEVNIGTGYKPNDKYEGINYKNFYGTYLLGPLLIRNPYLTDIIVNKLLDNDYKTNDNHVEYQAYEEYLKNFVE